MLQVHIEPPRLMAERAVTPPPRPLWHVPNLRTGQPVLTVLPALQLSWRRDPSTVDITILKIPIFSVAFKKNECFKNG